MSLIDFQFLFSPLEGLDEWLTGLFSGAPLLVALAIAFVLGLRHASDPDHLVAVTSLVAADNRGTRGATRLGFWWGVGHAATLLFLGVPLIAFKSALPSWAESGAEKAVGVVIIVLALRVIWKWARGQYRAGRHVHPGPAPAGPHGSHRHLRHGQSQAAHPHHKARTPQQALGIGFLHGLAGTGAVVVLLLAALPSRLDAALALAVFAPMTIVSMAACTTALAWVLTRPIVEPIYRAVLIPVLGTFGFVFGLWYVGIG
jgi:ABC-type nickel/cobalt efflux system permease component RcnA